MKPILFNTEMVRAILEGRKTVTRRIIKLPRCGYFNEDPPRVIPRYRLGDVLWVRETWADLRGLGFGNDPRTDNPWMYAYKADTESGSYGDRARIDYGVKWRPSIHMPREAARLFLLVTDVRVERLQEITGYQARREGMNPIVFAQDRQAVDDAKCIRAFTSVWDTTIKPADREQYGWNANPWVWVIEFERCEKPKEATYAES